MEINRIDKVNKNVVKNKREKAERVEKVKVKKAERVEKVKVKNADKTEKVIKSGIKNIISSIKYAIITKKFFVILFVLLLMFPLYYTGEYSNVTPQGLVFKNPNFKVSFYKPDVTLEKTTIQIVKDNSSPVQYNFMRFEHDNDILYLKFNSLLDASHVKFFALKKEMTKDGNYPAVPIQYSGSKIPLNSSYLGSFAAVNPPFQADINNDGKKETVSLCSKIDSIFTQGQVPIFSPVMHPEVPMEIMNLNFGAIEIFYHMKPLENAEVQLISNSGKIKKARTLPGGIVPVLPDMNLKDLRSGIQVVYVDKDNTYNISSYIVQSQTLFTKYHLKALTPVFKVVVLSTLLILLILVIRRIRPLVFRKIQDLKN